MREEILKILNSTNRKLNPKEIMDMIKEDNTVEELRELIVMERLKDEQLRVKLD